VSRGLSSRGVLVLAGAIVLALVATWILERTRTGRGLQAIASDLDGAHVVADKIRRAVQALIVSLIPVFAWAGPVDINKADATTIAKELDGIGKSRAEAIVAYREKNGAFKSVSDLLKVKGIGQKVLEQNRGNIRLEGGAEVSKKAG
jgi:competence protein ComEA